MTTPTPLADINFAMKHADCCDECTERAEAAAPSEEHYFEEKYNDLWAATREVAALDAERLARASHEASRASEGTFDGPDCECREFAIDLAAAYAAEVPA